MRNYSVFVALWIVGSVAAGAQAPTPPITKLTFDAWKAKLPFSFTYGGKDSAQVIAGWTHAEETKPSDGGETHRIIFTDPATKLAIRATVRSFTAYDALDVALEFTNGGATDTPILENIKLVAWDLDCVPNTPEISSYYGGTGNWESCAKHLAMLQPNAVTDLHTVTGLSSDQLLPYFNLHDEKWNGTAFDEGFQGMIIAIGWIGNWEADFLWKGSGPVNLRAGMPKTHLLLHPGETIRTPRIVLMNWVGTEADSQNIWRRFVRDFYSPKPLCGHIPKGQSAKPSAQ